MLILRYCSKKTFLFIFGINTNKKDLLYRGYFGNEFSRTKVFRSVSSRKGLGGGWNCVKYVFFALREKRWSNSYYLLTVLSNQVNRMSDAQHTTSQPPKGSRVRPILKTYFILYFIIR